MSFEPNYERVVSNYKKRIGEMQSQIECRLQTANGEDVKEVLCANVRVNMLNGTVSQNAINFDGVAMVQVVYEAMEGNHKAVDYTLEFKDKYVTNSELMLADTIICADIIDIKVSIENGAIKVVAILNIIIDGIYADNYNILVSTTGEDVFAKYEDVAITSYVGVASEKFDTTCDVEINDAIDTILAVCPKTMIEKVEPNDNYVKVYGNVAVTVTYLTAGDKADIRTYDKIYDFTQEIALTGTTDTCAITSNISCMYQNTTITTNLGQDKSIINLIVPIEYKGYVWCEKNMQMITDMYCTHSEVNLTNESIFVQHNLEPMYFVERINGTVSIDDNDLLIDEVLGTCGSNVVIANQRIEGETLVVDGVASTQVIYKNNEMGKIVSYEVQLPFSVDLHIGAVPENANVHILAELSRVQVKARRGTDIEMSGDVVLYVNISTNSEDAIITEATLREEKRAFDSNLIIYIAKEGDTIWDIAKEMSVSEDIILEQNPKLSLPIEAGTRVVVYRQTYANI